MSAADPRYAEVNALHAQGYPAATQEQAGRCAQAIMRKFGRLEDASASRTVPMWRRTPLTDMGRHGARRCWASTRPTAGYIKGWGRLAHDMAHRVYRYRHPGQRPHGPGESSIELAVAQFVREWISIVVVSAPRRPKADKVQATANAIERWERKLKRAENALKKLRRRQSAQMRRRAAVSLNEAPTP